MGWTGRIDFRASLLGQRRRLGDTMVPEQVEMTLRGDRGQPDLTATFAVVNGRPECLSITATAKPRGRGLRTADLALLNVDTMATVAFGHFADPVRDGTDIDGSAMVMPTAEVSERESWAMHRDLVESRSRGRRGPSQRELEEVAEVYRDNVASNPTLAVQQTFSYPKRTAARRVEQCRAAGLLPPTTRGKVTS